MTDLLSVKLRCLIYLQTMICGSRRLVVLVVLATSLAFAPSALAAEPGQITGTVTNASTGERINGIKVCAFPEHPGAYNCAQTEPDGEYTVPELKPGEYKVEFSAGGSNYLRQFYDGKPSSSEAQLVTVAAGQTTLGVDAALQEGARITGKVTDASTQEARDGIQVCAISVGTGDSWCGSSIGLSGGYEIAQIPTGEYKVKFSPPFESGLNYSPQFYNDESSSSQAQVLSITAGSLTPGIDAALKEGGRVKGFVRDASTQAGLEGVQVCAKEGSGEVSVCAKTDWTGEYTLVGLASGEYEIEAFPGNLGYLPATHPGSVSVSAGSTTYEVNMVVAKAGRIAGRVTNAATGAPIQGIQVCVSETTDGTTWDNCATTSSNGEYVLSGFAGGEYRVNFKPYELDYLYASVTVSVTAGQTDSGVDAALIEGGRMTGRITDAVTGEPVEEAEACAHEVRGGGEQCGTANANGEYTILRLPSGEYHVEFRSRVSHYLPEFYGGKFTSSEASPVSVTAPGTTSPIDGALQPGVFQEPANTAPPVVSGTPTVGSTLSCAPGSWTGDPAPTFRYIWLRDGTEIAGANESSYTAQSADEGQDVSCEVLATGEAGNMLGIAHASSASVLIGAGSSIEAPIISQQPATATTPDLTGSALSVTTKPLVTLMTSDVVVSGDTAPVGVECQAAACRGSIELTVQVPVKDGKGKTAADRKTTLVLATGSFALAEGKRGTVVLRLTAAGKKQLSHASRHHPIAAKLILSVQSGKTATKSVLAV
jgi:hypothetical protein